MIIYFANQKQPAVLAKGDCFPWRLTSVWHHKITSLLPAESRVPVPEKAASYYCTVPRHYH